MKNKKYQKILKQLEKIMKELLNLNFSILWTNKAIWKHSEKVNTINFWGLKKIPKLIIRSITSTNGSLYKVSKLIDTLRLHKEMKSLLNDSEQIEKSMDDLETYESTLARAEDRH